MKIEAPVPGKRVRGSQTGRPLMAALDLFGRRGTLRILWELHGRAPLTFRALQTASELSPATLNTRLRELREAGLVEAEGGYRLAELGEELLPALRPLHDWAVTWAKWRERAKPKSKPKKSMREPG